jgi:ATP-dependent RNA helicase MSS116, mitochondrial
MFKAVVQRNARLGSAARFQVARLATPRAVRLPTLEQQRLVGARLSSITSQLNPARQFAIRFYSEAAAQQAPVEEDGPSSPVTRFADLTQLGVNSSLVDAITKGMGYESMTEVQSMTINPAMRGIDLVAQAKTGTGKTLAFLVPVFQRLLQSQPELADRRNRRRAASNNVQAIILSPTRELAEQIGVEAQKLAKNTGIVVQTAVGGTRKRESLFKMKREGCDVLVATPGRLHDLLSDEYSGVDAPNLQVMILDEADRMLDVGFSDAISDILDQLPRVEDVDRQTLLFSATIPKDVVHLAKSMVKQDNFEFIQTIRRDEAPTHEKVPQHIVTCNGYENLFPAVLEILSTAQKQAQEDSSARPVKAIVFFSNTATVQFAYDIFMSTQLNDRSSGMRMYSIHSKLTQTSRTRNADNFRAAKRAILFSSDVTARGMDFPGVTHVIQVGLPPDRDQYIHRVGRTGRAGADGEGWLILANAEIPEARERLRGLPIKPNDTLGTAGHDLTQGLPSSDAAQYFEDISRGYKRAPEYSFNEVYHAMLGGKLGRRITKSDIADLLANWSQYGLERDQVPAISASKARNTGLTRCRSIRIGEEHRAPRERFPGGDRFSRGSDRFSQNGRGGGRGSRDNFADRFGSSFSDRSDRRGDGRGSRGPQASF